MNMLKKILLSVIFGLLSFSISLAGDITPSGMNQGDVYQLLRNMQLDSIYEVHGNPACAQVASPNSANVKTTVAVVVEDAGVLYAFGTTANIDLSGLTGVSTWGAQTYAAYPTRHYLLSVDGSTGSVYATRSSGDWLPNRKAGYSPLCDIKITLNSDGVYTFGTTALDQVSINATITNISSLASGGYKIQMTDFPAISE